jgi:hypothetical protein
MLWRTSRPAKRPGIIEPCIPILASKPPEGPKWIHEIKHDGYRLIARKRDDKMRLFTRGGYDWTDRYPRFSQLGPPWTKCRPCAGRRRELGADHSQPHSPNPERSTPGGAYHPAEPYRAPSFKATSLLP